jgi:hypothetical protein
MTSIGQTEITSQSDDDRSVHPSVGPRSGCAGPAHIPHEIVICPLEGWELSRLAATRLLQRNIEALHRGYLLTIHLDDEVQGLPEGLPPGRDASVAGIPPAGRFVSKVTGPIFVAAPQPSWLLRRVLPHPSLYLTQLHGRLAPRPAFPDCRAPTVHFLFPR